MAATHSTNLLDVNHSRQKRARGQLSCTPCRAGKLKCNRLRDPACDQCIKRGREDVCQYVPPPAKAKPSGNVRGRIRQLETLVKDLMVQQQYSGAAHIDNHPTPPSDNDSSKAFSSIGQSHSSVEASLGQLEIGEEEVAYTGENHWQTILSSLKDIQNDLEEDDTQDAEDISNQCFDAASENFILGNTRKMTREELISMMPDKRTSDRLLSLWFNSADPFKVIIHGPTFQQEYKEYYRNPSAPTMWLGLYFAILCLGESFGLRNATPGSPGSAECASRVRHYQSLCASAAVLGQYTKPKSYTIECLMIYMVSLRCENAVMNAWLIMGIIIRLALRMGYHRDPGHYPKITAFQAEMRRRVWSLTNMIDVLMSFQLGLPSMVRTVASDTQPPSNLLDRDFTRSMAILPAGRGEHELTPSLYTRAKLRIMHVFSEAAELSHATIPPRFELIQQLNDNLERAKEDVPLALRMPDISELVTDPAEQLMCRFNIDLLYLKCKIVLCRRYMLVPFADLSQAEQDRGIGACREACIKSARKVLDHHHTIYNAIQPGGQLENMRWYMGSIAVHDFLLAAMVICLELSQQLKKDEMLCPTRQEMLKSLEQSRHIWETTAQQTSSNTRGDQSSGLQSGDMYEETRKASKVMSAMLAKIKAQEIAAPQESLPKTSNIFEAATGTYFDNIGLTKRGARAYRAQGDPFHGVVSSHQWDGIPDGFQLGEQYTPNPAVYDTTVERPQSNSQECEVSLSTDHELTDDPMTLDWQAWDHEIFATELQHGISWSTQQAVDFMQSIDVSSRSDNAQVSSASHGTLQSLSTDTGMDFSVEDMASFEFDSNLYSSFVPGKTSSAR